MAVFLLVFVVIAGAWLGFWVVRKLVLTEDGSVDTSTSRFVAWSIRILERQLEDLREELQREKERTQRAEEQARQASTT